MLTVDETLLYWNLYALSRSANRQANSFYPGPGPDYLPKLKLKQFLETVPNSNADFCWWHNLFYDLKIFLCQALNTQLRLIIRYRMIPIRGVHRFKNDRRRLAECWWVGGGASTDILCRWRRRYFFFRKILKHFFLFLWLKAIYVTSKQTLPEIRTVTLWLTEKRENRLGQNVCSC